MTTENCGRGHDVSKICCAHAADVLDRLYPAERALEEIDACATVILCGDHEQADTAQKVLGELLFQRVKDRVQLLWAQNTIP